MPKLLTEKEAQAIAAKMADEYGLECHISVELNDETSNCVGFSCIIGQKVEVPYRWFPWVKQNKLLRRIDISAYDLEDLLGRVQRELKRFDSQAKIAETLRSQYDMEEANQAIDKMLRE